MLPREIIDHILSFCEGHIRADLRVKHIGVPLKQKTYNIVDKILLEEHSMTVSNGVAHYINKRNTMWNVGYVCKMVKDGDITYTWVTQTFY